jgi:hypothetical protein
MDTKYELIVEAVEGQISSLLVGLDDTNSLDRILVIQKIIRDIEKVEETMKDTIDIETEMIAFSKTGIKKRYPDTNKENIDGYYVC